MSPDELRAIGERLWGRWGWQTRMAETLRVDGSTVRRWLSGATAIPGPAAVALELLVELSEARRDGRRERQAPPAQRVRRNDIP
jgi:DNA-binding transcriptional regulator YiaG